MAETVSLDEVSLPLLTGTSSRGYSYQMVRTVVNEQIDARPVTTTQPPGASSDPLAQSAAAIPIEMYAPPSREQLFWARHLAWLLAPNGRPSLLARAWGVMAVAPFAHITFFSLSYQAYLYDVFHQTKNARFWHQVCMPLNNLMLMVAPASVTAGSIDGRTIYAALILAWCLAQVV